jgi:hypothetical protein
MKGMFHDLRVVLIAVVASMVLAAAPAMAAAYDAMNADNVDGHGAVGSKSKPGQRANSLIAANKRGYLPNNAIRKTRDSARLGGQPRTSFIERTSDAGELQSGIWAVNGTGSSRGAAAVRFLETMTVQVEPGSVYFVQPGMSTADCPGPGQAVAQGVVCVYVTQQVNTTALHARNPLTGAFGVAKEGFVITGVFDADGYAYGTWAARSGE